MPSAPIMSRKACILSRVPSRGLQLEVSVFDNAMQEWVTGLEWEIERDPFAGSPTEVDTSADPPHAPSGVRITKGVHGA